MSCCYADIATAKYDVFVGLLPKGLNLVFGKDLEMILLYYGNMVPLLSLPF